MKYILGNFEFMAVSELLIFCNTDIDKVRNINQTVYKIPIQRIWHHGTDEMVSTRVAEKLKKIINGSVISI